MKITSQQAEKLLKGNQSFGQLGFSMLLMRLKMVYANDPSPATLQHCTGEINVFLGKFTSLMSKDYETITKM